MSQGIGENPQCSYQGVFEKELKHGGCRVMSGITAMGAWGVLMEGGSFHLPSDWNCIVSDRGLHPQKCSSLFTAFFFQYWLEASGISIKLGDQGLFLPVLMLVGKQLVCCITEETYKDSRSGMVFCLWGGKIFSSPSFLHLSSYLLCLPAFDGWEKESYIWRLKIFPLSFFPVLLHLLLPTCCISISGCQCLCLWCQCHSSCGNQILFCCIVLTNMFPAFCLFCCSSRFQSLER